MVRKMSLPATRLIGIVLLLGVFVALGNYERMPEVFSRAAQDRKAAGDAPPLPQAGRPEAIAETPQPLPIGDEVAVRINAERPFSDLPVVAARPFKSSLTGDDRDRAISCLAMAALYEAGASAEGQRAVMQVVLNRVRHPAFPSNVCGVVFQGAERTTGCQFTFTCDGAMHRWTPSAEALAAAKQRAQAMLDGDVEERVGLSTHYHTDWVVPYWSASLDKVTAIESHLFFRWKGFWGKPAALRIKPLPSEPQIKQLASFDEAHRSTTVADAPPEEDQAPAQTGSSAEASAGVMLIDPRGPQRRSPLRMALAPAGTPGRWALNAVGKCAKQSDCRVVGWVDAQAAPAEITQASITASPPDFVYVQLLRDRVQQAYWNCAKWPPAGSARCIGTPKDAAGLALGSG